MQDLDETRRFYADVLGCEIGRSSDSWLDFSLFGHQMSAHLRPDAVVAARDGSVAQRGGRTVPIPHFGVVLLMDEWERLAKKLEGNSGTDWIERPTIRFRGQARRAGHALHPRPFRQCARIQGFPLAGACVLNIRRPAGGTRQREGLDAVTTGDPRHTAKFVTGSTMRHVIVMTATGSIGLVAIFVVDALNLFYISLLGVQ